MPYRLRRDALTPNGASSIDAPENDSILGAGGCDPVVNRGLRPGRNRDCSDVFALADQVGDYPAVLPELNIFKF